MGAATNPLASQRRTIGVISELGLLDVDDIVDQAVGQASPAEYVPLAIGPLPAMLVCVLFFTHAPPLQRACRG